MMDGPHFTREEVTKVVQALAGAMKALAASPEGMARLSAAGTSEERVQAIIDETQRKAFIDAGFAETRFDDIRCIYQDYASDAEVRKAMEYLCGTEEMFLNAVLARNGGAMAPQGLGDAGAAAGGPPTAPGSMSMKM